MERHIHVNCRVLEVWKIPKSASWTVAPLVARPNLYSESHSARHRAATIRDLYKRRKRKKEKYGLAENTNTNKYRWEDSEYRRKQQQLNTKTSKTAKIQPVKGTVDVVLPSKYWSEWFKIFGDFPTRHLDLSSRTRRSPLAIVGHGFLVQIGRGGPIGESHHSTWYQIWVAVVLDEDSGSVAAQVERRIESTNPWPRCLGNGSYYMSQTIRFDGIENKGMTITYPSIHLKYKWFFTLSMPNLLIGSTWSNWSTAG